jgi:glycosyltransferase involved in cell wall biosynthesis
VVDVCTPVRSGRGRRVLQVLGPSAGGIRRHVAALADGLTEREWSVEVAGPAGVMEGLRPLDHVVTISRDLRAAAGSIGTLRHLIRTFDVVHAHGLTAGWSASLLPGRPPLVVTVHNLVLDEAEGRLAQLLRRIEDRLPARADAVIAISDQVARRFAGLRGADRITVVPPVGPVALSRQGADVRAELGVENDAPLVLLVGRLHPQKDVGGLLEATVEVRRRHPGVVVAVAGDGPQRTALVQQATRLGVDRTVRFLGARDDVADLMAAADVVVMCSVWESYGFVVTEALGLGRPLVATAVGPVPDLVIDGVTGRLVPPSEPAALADAIGDLLDDPDLAARLGSTGARHLGTKLDRGTLVDRVTAVYLDLLEDR